MWSRVLSVERYGREKRFVDNDMYIHILTCILGCYPLGSLGSWKLVRVLLKHALVNPYNF